MTNEEMLRIAQNQSAIELGCSPENFLRGGNTVVISRPAPLARKYLSLPFLCQIVWYGEGVVASTAEPYLEKVKAYIDRYPPEHLFETPNLHVLNDLFEKDGGRVCFMAEYFLPQTVNIQPLPCEYETRLLTHTDMEPLYRPEWSNALCEKRKESDVLGVGAYNEKGELVALAGCSSDCDDMWQIGIDVLPAYRHRGIASALTSRLASEILMREKVPFYCAAWSNIPSVRNAIRSGFRPAWVELTVKPKSFVDEMNGTAQ